jgi:hypothetical protein
VGGREGGRERKRAKNVLDTTQYPNPLVPTCTHTHTSKRPHARTHTRARSLLSATEELTQSGIRP